MPMPTIKSDYLKGWTQDVKAGDKYYTGEGSGQGWYPIWRTDTEAKLQSGINQVDPNKTTGGFSGVDYNYFTELLKKQMETGDPNQALYRQNAQTQINRGVDTSSLRLQEQLAQSGMSRSGVATGAMANLEMGRADAMGNAETQLTAQDQAYRSNAFARLLGLQELGLQELGQNRSYYANQLGMQLDQEKWNKQFDYQKDQDKFNFWRDALPGIISGAGQVGAAAIAASDRRLKENISQVGKSPKGINVYEFNYIGSPQRFRGAMADENPSATFEKDGIKFLDYSKIDVKFEAL